MISGLWLLLCATFFASSGKRDRASAVPVGAAIQGQAAAMALDRALGRRVLRALRGGQNQQKRNESFAKRNQRFREACCKSLKSLGREIKISPDRLFSMR
jgi:hypothetical protein